MHRPIIGFFGKAMGSIGVERPQDLKFGGAGFITLAGETAVNGEDTKFTEQLTPGAQIIVKVNDVKHTLVVGVSIFIYKKITKELNLKLY